ncbi:MAG: hypothetical protein NDJ92_21200, partial [Thermoanaerobaculia bacterium]|nr:hypothetical protein [Thermoanaerobaculia bacterium]
IAALIGWALLRSSSGTPVYQAIAVLPIENPDSATTYVSDGIAEAIIDGLSTSPAIRVTSRTSSFPYRKPPLDLRKVGRERGVTAVVTGRLARRGDDSLLRLELVDTNDGAQLWAKDYTQRTSDIDTLRARAVRDLSLRLGVSNADRPSAVKNAEVYDLYLRGRYHWNLRSVEDQLRAVEYFQRAVELDPNFAPGWAGLANVYGTLVGSSLVPGREEETQLKAIDAAKRAIAIDATNAEAYASLAASKVTYYRDYAGAERDYKRAIALNPSIPSAHHWYASLLARLGREDEARRELDIGWRLDPFSRSANHSRCFGRIMARRYGEALELARQTQQRDPETRLSWCVLWASVMTGDVDGALEATSRAHPDRAAAFEKGVRLEGMKGLLRAHLEYRAEIPEYERAALHAMLGERDPAFAELERSFAMNRAFTGFLWIDPRFDSIHDDPRLLDLALRLNLPQAREAARRAKSGS